MKNILITGANSYIGTSFEKYIADKYSDNYSVTTLDMLGDEWKAFDFSPFDAVFHVAGIAHIKETKKNSDLYYSVNRDLAAQVANKAKAAGVKQFVFLSSMSVYGLERGFITKDTKPKPKTNYGKSKLQAEEAVIGLKDESFIVAVLRPPMVYGKGCKGNYNALRKLALKLPLFPYVNNKRSMLYIDNLCEFVRFAIDDSADGIFYPQNSEYVNTSDMAKFIGKLCNKRVRLVKGFGWLIKICGLFVGKLRKAFGSLTYDKSMSGDLQSYNVCNFALSVAMTEMPDE